MQGDVYTMLFAARDRIARLEAALERIAAPARPDGTYNLERAACQQIAARALTGDAT